MGGGSFGSIQKSLHILICKRGVDTAWLSIVRRFKRGEGLVCIDTWWPLYRLVRHDSHWIARHDVVEDSDRSL